MKSVLTVKENDIIARAMGNPQLTNCYLSYADLAKKIETNEISCFRHGSILVLLHMMEGFYKFYYFMETPDVPDPATFAGIQEVLGKYPVLVAEIVTKTQDSIPPILKKMGFCPYKKYIRKQLITGSENISGNSDRVELADVRDLNDIYQLLYSTFDVISDHLVTKEELQFFITSSQTLKLCVGDKMAGVLIFETFGRKSYLRTICVSEEFIGRNMGRSLIETYIKWKGDGTKLFYLWVESTNEKAIHLYDSIGYRDDGLTEYIYRKGQWH